MAVTWITATDLDDPTNPESAKAAQYASWILYKLTAEKYAGVRSATEWYGISGSNCAICTSSVVSGGIISVGENHGHINVAPAELSSFSTRGLLLRGRPATSISAVVSETGETAPTTSYSLVNNAYLINTDTSCWDLRNGVTVAYKFGARPPVAGRLAAIRLATELLKLAANDNTCSLPDRVTSVSRQGISYTILDPQEFIRDGRTGIYEIDLFLQAANPSKAKKRPRVFVPGAPRGERYR